MAYLLHYKMRFEQNIGTEEEPNIVECFQPAFVRATDADYDIQMAFAKAEAYNGEVTEEDVPMTAEEVRAERDRLLAATDWTQVLDAPISAESRAEMRVYRQALRNVPQQPGFPAAVEWPVMPTIVPAEPDPVDEAFDVLTGEEAT